MRSCAGNDVTSHVKVVSPKHGRFRQLLERAMKPDADVRWEKVKLCFFVEPICRCSAQEVLNY